MKIVEDNRRNVDMVTRKTAKAQAEEILRDYLIVADIGFGFLKAFSNVKPELLVIPSTVSIGHGKAASVVDNDGTVNIDNLVIQVGDQTAYVGKRALVSTYDRKRKRTKERNRAEDLKSQFLFHTAIALSLPDEDGDYDNVIFATGLPVSDYGTKIQDDLEEFLMKPFTAKIYVGPNKYIEKRISLKKVFFYRQPEGTYIHSQLKLGNVPAGEGLLIPKPNFKKFIGIIDIGHITTDYCLFSGLEMADEAYVSNSTFGTNEVYAKAGFKAIDYLHREYGRYTVKKLSEIQLDHLIHNKEYVVQGDLPIDLTEVVDEEVADVGHDMASEIFERWEYQLEELEGIVLTGGGAELFEDAFRDEFNARGSNTFIKHHKSQVGNVIGYYMAAISQIEDEEELSIEDIYEEYVIPALPVLEGDE